MVLKQRDAPPMPWRPPAVSRSGGPRGVGHRPSVTWPQCRGHLSHTSLFVNRLPAPGDSGLLGLISVLGIKEDFFRHVCLSNVTRVLLFCSKPDLLLGPGVLSGLDSGDCMSQDHSGVDPNSQPCGCGHSVAVVSLIPVSRSLRKPSTPGNWLVAALHQGALGLACRLPLAPTPSRPS